MIEAIDVSLLYSELVRLRVIGLRSGITTELSLPQLMRVADAACPEESDEIDRLRKAMSRAAKRLGGGDYSLALEILWGVDTTFGKSLDHRRKKAMPLLGAQSKQAYDRSHRKRAAKDFAAALRGLYAEATKATEADTAKDEAEVAIGLPEPSSGRAGDKSPAGFWRPKAVAALILVLVLILTTGLWLRTGSSHSLSVPPPGTVINARTGEIDPHPVIKGAHRVDLVGGGLILRACNLSDDPSCYFRGGSFSAKIGDTIRVVVILMNLAPEPLPYAKVSVGFLRNIWMKPWQVPINAQIVWPPGRERHAKGLPELTPLTVEGPPRSGPITLNYIPGSTVLRNPNRSIIARLPDTINELRGIALSNIGIPKGCFFNCQAGFIRYLEFEAEVVKDTELIKVPSK